MQTMLTVAERIHRVRGVINNSYIPADHTGIYGLWFFVGKNIRREFLNSCKLFGALNEKFVEHMKNRGASIVCKTGTTSQDCFKQRISTQISNARFRTGSGQNVPHAVHDALLEDPSLECMAVPVAIKIVLDDYATDQELEEIYGNQGYFKKFGVVPNNAATFSRKKGRSDSRPAGNSYVVNLLAPV